MQTLSFSGRGKGAEPAVGSRREEQSQQATEASSEADPGCRSKTRTWIRLQIQQTPAGSFQASPEGDGPCCQHEESITGPRWAKPAGPGAKEAGEAQRDVGQGRSQLLHFLKILKIQVTSRGRAAR